MSVQYFSLDRRGFYKVGEDLGLYKKNPFVHSPLVTVLNLVAQDDLQKHLNDIFPDGLSLHGWDYMTRASLVSSYMPQPPHAFVPITTYDHSTILELVLEYVRRSTFADCPSRLQSYFAYTSLSKAQDFQQKNGKTHHKIYRLYADRVIKVDQTWLKLGTQNALGSYFANRFWSSIGSPTPEWEHMLVPPVHVVEQIP